MQKHRPPHIYLNHQHYFLTAATYHKISYIDNRLKKNLLKDLISHVFNRYNYRLEAWVLLDNHYHLLFQTSLGKYLPKAMATIHGKCAIEFNKIDRKYGRKVWYQYWDYCIRNEADYWRHFNYIHQNPIKHSYIDRINNLSTFQFSSFGNWVKKKGKDWIYGCFRDYSIIDFTREEDNF